MPRRALILRGAILDAAVACAMAAALLLFSFSTPYISGGDDAYRHVRFANRLVTETQAALADPWRLAYLWPKPVDMWFGYHLLLAPFTLVLPLIAAAKLVGSLVWGATAFAILRLLDRLKVPWRHAWVILAMAGSGIVLYRATLMRPFLISLFLVVLATRFTLDEKPWRLAIVSALHAASYSIFFMAAFPVGACVLVRRNTASLRLAAACAGGLGLGLLLNPFFPENAKLSLATAFTVAGPDLARQLNAGGEVLPLSPWWLVASLPVVIVWIAAIVRWTRNERTPAQATLLLMSLLALAASLRAARAFDYFVPMAALFAASVLSDLIPRHREKSGYAFGFLYLLAAASLIPAFATIGKAPSIDRYRAPAEYLAREAPGALVVNTQWEQYPLLYFWNWQSRYVTGMEPALFYRADPDRYRQWRKLADDAGDASDAASIAARLRSRHFVVDEIKTPKLAAALRSDARFDEALAADGVAVFTLDAR